jgi:molybdenum cofactor cytidylyltransferase
MRIAAIVLAAGRSSRMGLRNKLLEPIEGEPMIRRVVGVAVASGAAPVVVVTGHEPQSVAESLRGLGVSVIFNPDYANGLSTSLRSGLAALPSGIEGVLILLGDMPAVDLDALAALMTAFTGQTAICVPVRKGRRGNPVLWGRRYFAEMKALTGDKGAKPLMARHESAVIEVEMTTDGIFTDIDAPEDFARLRPSEAGG